MIIPPTLDAPTAPTAAQRLGELLRRERQIAKLSQRTLADRVGIHQASLARWELGRSAPTLAQADRVLGRFGLRLRLDVEPCPDPRLAWDREALRLGSMTPAERLDEVEGFDLATLMERARQRDVTGYVDGQCAAWLQGIPGRPRWMEIAVTPDQVLAWVTLERVVSGPLEESLLRLRLSKADAAEQFIEDGHGLLASIFGYLRIRVLESPPPTVRLRLREADEEVAEPIDAEVIRLDRACRPLAAAAALEIGAGAHHEVGQQRHRGDQQP